MRPRLPVLLAAALLAIPACTSAASATATAAHTSSGHASAGHTGTAPRVAAAAPADWPTYHLNTDRNAAYPSMPAFTTLTATKKLALDGPVYASPIVVHGVLVVATENNTVYAFDSAYRQLWKTHLGAPARLSQLPCGNIDPLGITGTPVYLSATRQIYVAPEFAGTSTPTHALFAINVDTGRPTFAHSLDLPGVDQRVMQERGALTIVGSQVYVPFGGLNGDCGSYKGRIVSFGVTGHGGPTSYTVPTAREAGIWTPPGLTADSAGHLLAAVGNGASTTGGGAYDRSDSVLQFSTTLKPTDYFSPSSWREDNAADKDLGSQGPTLVGPWVFQAGKSGTAYVLRRASFGGIGHPVSQATVCRSFGGTARYGQVAYVPCTDGVRAVQIDSAGRMHIQWQASESITGSPVYGGGRIFALDTGAGVLHALSLTNGATTQSVAVGNVSRFATPAEYGSNLYVPTLSGVTVVHAS